MHASVHMSWPKEEQPLQTSESMSCKDGAAASLSGLSWSQTALDRRVSSATVKHGG